MWYGGKLQTLILCPFIPFYVWHKVKIKEISFMHIQKQQHLVVTSQDIYFFALVYPVGDGLSLQPEQTDSLHLASIFATLKINISFIDSPLVGVKVNSVVLAPFSPLTIWNDLSLLTPTTLWVVLKKETSSEQGTLELCRFVYILTSRLLQGMVEGFYSISMR